MNFAAKTALALVAIAAPIASAQAQTTVYKGYDANNNSGTAAKTNANAASASFQSALSGTSTESFEGFAAGAGAPLTLNFAGSAGPLTATLSGGGSVQAGTANATSGDRFPTQGSKYYSATSTNFQITFGSAVAAFGFYATDIESDVQVILTRVSGATETYGFASLFPAVNYGTAFGSPTASVNFLGFINTTDLFKSVTFGQGGNSSGDILGFDQMTIGDAQQVVNPPSGAVPEPATWAMMIAGFGVVGGAMRRRASQTLATA